MVYEGRVKNWMAWLVVAGLMWLIPWRWVKFSLVAGFLVFLGLGV